MKRAAPTPRSATSAAASSSSQNTTIQVGSGNPSSTTIQAAQPQGRANFFTLVVHFEMVNTENLFDAGSNVCFLDGSSLRSGLAKDRHCLTTVTDRALSTITLPNLPAGVTRLVQASKATSLKRSAEGSAGNARVAAGSPLAGSFHPLASHLQSCRGSACNPDCKLAASQGLAVDSTRPG